MRLLPDSVKRSNQTNVPKAYADSIASPILQLYNSTTLQLYNFTALQLYSFTTLQLYNSTTCTPLPFLIKIEIHCNRYAKDVNSLKQMINC